MNKKFPWLEAVIIAVILVVLGGVYFINHKQDLACKAGGYEGTAFGYSGLFFHLTVDTYCEQKDGTLIPIAHANLRFK